jgi:ABC-type Zn uptake system ZnuABC Zn-binding protein ZnuA
MRKTFFIVILTILSVLVLTSCGSRPSEAGGGLNILATTSFLADITRNVTGDRVQVDSLLPVGADPHAYQVTPTDAAKINKSTVLIENGVGYEHFLEPILDNAGGERLVITASDGLTPRQMQSADKGQAQEAGDPHMWLDPILVITYVENIRDGLIQADPEGEAMYTANADAYIESLRELDAWIRAQVESIPAERRLLVTNHEALGYFADQYGFAIVGTVIPSLSTGASTSAQEMAAVIEQIKSTGAPAIFLGDVENPNLANQIAAETGIKVVENLHLESLTDGAPASTYIEMMKFNVTQIVEALR